MHIVHCAMCNVQCTYTMCIVHTHCAIIFYHIYSTFFTAECIIYSVHYKLYSIHYTLYSIQYTIYNNIMVTNAIQSLFILKILPMIILQYYLVTYMYVPVILVKLTFTATTPAA